MNRKELTSTYELIPRHRRRAFLRRCFARLAEVVNGKDVSVTDICNALRAFEQVLTLAEHQKPEERLVNAVFGSSEPTPEEARKQLTEYVRREYGVDLMSLRN